MDYKFTEEGIWVHVKFGRLIDKEIMIPGYVLKEIYIRYMKED